MVLSAHAHPTAGSEAARFRSRTTARPKGTARFAPLLRRVGSAHAIPHPRNPAAARLPTAARVLSATRIPHRETLTCRFATGCAGVESLTRIPTRRETPELLAASRVGARPRAVMALALCLISRAVEGQGSRITALCRHDRPRSTRARSAPRAPRLPGVGRRASPLGRDRAVSLSASRSRHRRPPAGCFQSSSTQGSRLAEKLRRRPGAIDADLGGSSKRTLRGLRRMIAEYNAS